MKKILIFIFILITLQLVLAHQPRIDFPKGTIDNPTIIKNPEISKAFYNELTGNPHYYKITSNKPFLLYINILSPDIPNTRTDFIVEISNNTYHILNNSNWTKFHEPFSNNNYLKGSEFQKQSPPSTYLIKVSNYNNLGKYSLAIGKKESFPPIEILKTIYTLPKIKTFFNESPLTAFFNFSGLFLLLILFTISLLFFIIKKLYNFFN